jgi:hypothetical protein
MIKIVINTCYGGFGLSEKAYEELGIKWNGYGFAYDGYDKRADPKLVACVEKLGSDVASGTFAKLKIVEIPNDVVWEIEEYDGIETVREVSRTWD